ncbi:MAG: C-terminal binding protein [Rhodothalassiaceae bacterium]
MSRPRIVLTDSVFPSLAPAEAVLARIDADLVVAPDAEAATIGRLAADADAVMVTFAKLDADLIARLTRCRVIGRFGIGVDNIDLEAASRAGIQVVFCPDYCLDEVSDHALALLLTLARKTALADRLVQAGDWTLKPLAPIWRLRGRVLGLVGFGKIPRTLVPKAQALGLEVIASDPFAPDALFQEVGVRRVTFEALLGEADFISIHAPLTEKTHHLFNAEAFRRMKREAILVNTARGPLVDEAALAAALDAGEIAAAGLDVVETEPLPADSPLRGRDNVLITPHAAFYSEDALVELQTGVAEDVVRVLGGEAPLNPANRL